MHRFIISDLLPKKMSDNKNIGFPLKCEKPILLYCLGFFANFAGVNAVYFVKNFEK